MRAPLRIRATVMAVIVPILRPSQYGGIPYSMVCFVQLYRSTIDIAAAL